MARTQSDFMTGRKTVPQPADGSIWVVPIDVKLGAAPVLNDILALIALPPLVEVVDWDIITPQMDSGATLAGTLGIENVAMTDIATPFGSALALGRNATGSIVRATTAEASQADAIGMRVISLKWTAVAAGWVGTGKTMRVMLHLKS